MNVTQKAEKLTHYCFLSYYVSTSLTEKLILSQVNHTQSTTDLVFAGASARTVSSRISLNYLNNSVNEKTIRIHYDVHTALPKQTGLEPLHFPLAWHTWLSSPSKWWFDLHVYVTLELYLVLVAMWRNPPYGFPGSPQSATENCIHKNKPQEFL